MKLLKLPEFFSLMAGVALCACAAQTASSQPPIADSSMAGDQAASELREHHRHHHLGGVTQFIAMSIDTLGIDDARLAQVDQLRSSLHVCMAPAGAVANKLLLAFADGAASGAIDTAKVDATVDQLNSAAASVPGCSADALNRLHALLLPTERATLVDKVQAHWEVWRQVNDEALGNGHEPGSQLAELGLELSLTADQVAAIAQTLHTPLAALAGRFDPNKAEAYVQAFTSAFGGEVFDARSIAANATGPLATHGSMRMAIFYENVAPLLTSKQRVTLAEHLREHASHQPQIK